MGWKWASKLTYSFVCWETSVEAFQKELSLALEEDLNGTVLSSVVFEFKTQ
jgi:hypothetical protein